MTTSIPREMAMTRRVTFSSGHRYWRNNLSEAENRALYGPWASPFNHGHNYVLYVTVTGEVDPRTAMLVNIKRIDDVLKAHVLAAFDGKSINDEVPAFQTRSSTLENLLAYFAELMERELKVYPEVRLSHLKLEEHALLYAEFDLQTRAMTLTRIYEFAASHRLHVPNLSEDENIALFGKCNNPAGHGHNYVLEVTVQGEPDPQTGMMCDLGALDAAVNTHVVDRYDHKNLNVDIPEFQDRPTTSEIVAQTIFARLVDQVPAKLHRVRLYETARNAFEVTAD